MKLKKNYHDELDLKKDYKAFQTNPTHQEFSNHTRAHPKYFLKNVNLIFEFNLNFLFNIQQFSHYKF